MTSIIIFPQPMQAVGLNVSSTTSMSNFFPHSEQTTFFFMIKPSDYASEVLIAVILPPGVNVAEDSNVLIGVAPPSLTLTQSVLSDE